MNINSHKKLKEIKFFKISTFKDFRGEIWTSWEKKYFKNLTFNLDKFTTSKKMFLEDFMVIKNLGN